MFFQRIANDPLERLTKISRLTSSLLADGNSPLLTECERLTSASPAQLSENEFFEAIWPHSDISRIPERVEELKKWLSEDPDSVFARIVLADYSYHVAWRHRGSGFVSTVTDEGAAKFEEHIKEASAYLKGFEPGPETPDRYFELQFRLHTSSGASREEFDATADQTLQYCPLNLAAHEAATAYLMPRWLGNPGDVAEYVDRVIAVVGDEEGGKIQMSVIQMQLPYYREADFFEATGFQYAPLKTLLDKLLADKNRTKEQRDEVIAIYAGLARRAEDLSAVEAMVSEVMTGGWLARNKHHSRTYSDVGRTLNWLREKKGDAAIYQGIFDKIPLPKPGEDWPRPRSKAQTPSKSPPPKGADIDPSSPPQ